jgi:hypothetical protein
MIANLGGTSQNWKKKEPKLQQCSKKLSFYNCMRELPSITIGRVVVVEHKHLLFNLLDHFTNSYFRNNPKEPAAKSLGI